MQVMCIVAEAICLGAALFAAHRGINSRGVILFVLVGTPFVVAPMGWDHPCANMALWVPYVVVAVAVYAYGDHRQQRNAAPYVVH